jgi:hypothetical protein
MKLSHIGLVSDFWAKTSTLLTLLNGSPNHHEYAIHCTHPTPPSFPNAVFNGTLETKPDQFSFRF